MNQLGTQEQEPAQLLPAGTMLHRRYVVDGLLGCGAYGVTYYGHDEKTGTPLAMKEYFPQAIAARADEGLTLSPKNKASGSLFFLGSEMFYRQHLALTDAKGSESVVTVYDAFFENGTSYAAMERLEGVTLEQYLKLRRRRLFPDESMYIAASLADALLVVHSLNTLHYDISARSIVLCTDGSVKLAEFGAAKAGLRARRELDDAEPWLDLAAVARTLYEAMTGQAADEDDLRPHGNVPPELFDLFRQMLAADGRRVSSVFEYRHALACVELGAICPDVTVQDVQAALQYTKNNAARNRPQNDAESEQPKQPTQRRSVLDRALDAMESAVTSAPPKTAQQAKREQNVKRRIGLVYAGIVAGTLILALIVRELIR